MIAVLADHWAFLSLGFFIGMAHALEADHLAAVSAMLNGKSSRKALIARGAVWGVGHTLSLFTICTVVVLFGLTITGRVEAGLELAVGVMIVVLGCRVLWKLHRERIHVHVHAHADTRHIHLHSHAADPAPHEASAHDHRHAVRKGHLATMGIGMVHGAAGSAGLLVLAIAAADSIGQALAYFAVFGIGSMIGMAALTAVASYPLHLIERGAGWMRTATALGIGGLAIWVGGTLAMHSFAGLHLAGL
jgi:ABC-type nickel/cobalt efflux system permease component RcnA